MKTSYVTCSNNGFVFWLRFLGDSYEIYVVSINVCNIIISRDKCRIYYLGCE